MSLLFINNSSETFTPTQSGALATIIWECCCVARAQGLEPTVITRACAATPFPWPKTILLDYPRVPGGKLGIALFRAERKLTGWRNLRQREYAHRVVAAIRTLDAGTGSLVLMNDPEMAVTLRDAFPKAYIVHWFQNQHTCKARFRERFAGAVDVVLGVSNFIARWVESHYGIAAGRVGTLYNGVNTAQFHSASAGRDGVPVIGFVGRTGIEKGPDLLLKACLELAKGTRDFRVQMVGSNH